ncbi:type I-F CRISPR-associated helicase Cas3 [Formicincola oecophyllae]|uniref:Type I-F CRISPR-associated helicase Cas3 n=1 Tax=Formicincola oecophyllae TaxID=2558361 RepID=A0A4Y6U9K1_9PROT|nr:type I-F CRISPR-associated helicase Cas3f [Formicincola oecophyllae]QDH13228.1 type I-F CRISPR-associated helicase Cas3 [Formicincola oecophyllae]
MQVLLVSECEKKAKAETRRIVDQFACRTGGNTWLASMTEEGLQTLHAMLKRTARRNTAVACHRLGGPAGMELLWIVGNRERFDGLTGTVPTNSTQRLIMAEGENDDPNAPLVQALARLAALLHDLGKTAQAFQRKLRSGKIEKACYRHEWATVWMLRNLVRNSQQGDGPPSDVAWLERLAKGAGTKAAHWLDEPPSTDSEAMRQYLLKDLPPVARAVAWLVLTHHRMVAPPRSESTNKSAATLIDLEQPWRFLKATWNDAVPPGSVTDFKRYWSFPTVGAVVGDKRWQGALARRAGALLALCASWNPGKAHEMCMDVSILHCARLCLMLADHYFSSKQAFTLPSSPLAAIDLKKTPFANTAKRPSTGQMELHQTLVEHLLGVEKQASSLSRALPGLGSVLEGLGDCAPLKKMVNKNESALQPYRWQNKAVEEAQALYSQHNPGQAGAFVINMASTGCGKTLANGKIAYALNGSGEGSGPGLRLTVALGLRVLTRQTGAALQKHLGLAPSKASSGDGQVAVYAGGGTSAAIADWLQNRAEESGSESTAEVLLDPEGDVSAPLGSSGDEAWRLDELLRHPVLRALAKHHEGKQPSQKRDLKALEMVRVPVLACTVDHMVPVADCTRGPGGLAPMLRLMSSDLVLDELDDYGLADMPALMRLVWWAGVLGSRVVLSTATLPGTMAAGMFEAWHHGRAVWWQNHAGAEGAPMPAVPCLWVDEFNSQTELCADEEGFRQAHGAFVKKRRVALKNIASEAPKQRGEIMALGALKPPDYGRQELGQDFWDEIALAVRDKALEMGRRHHEKALGGRTISLGLVRMANVEPLIEVARALERLGSGREDTHIHLCVYHARFPLICRQAIEHGLDQVFDRHAKTPPLAERPLLAGAMNTPKAKAAKHHVFVVLASPVCEVGRDWDADWAIAEPSSMRSIIQLAGRVRRHRGVEVSIKSLHPNIALWNWNVRGLENEAEAYCKPGYEGTPNATTNPNHLASHELSAITQPDEWQTITSLPRLAGHLKQEVKKADGQLDIWPQEKINTYQSLTQLELGATAQAMLPWQMREAFSEAAQQAPIKSSFRTYAPLCWLYGSSALTAILPQSQPFRESSPEDEDTFCFQLNDDEQPILHQVLDQRSGQAGEMGYACKAFPTQECGAGISPWNRPDMVELVQAWVGEHGDMAAAFPTQTQLTAPRHRAGNLWRYSDWLGLSVKEG